MIAWYAASETGSRQSVNQDVAWHSDDGRLCLVADGGTRPGQRAELSSATCARVAARCYDPRAGDDLAELIVREVNSELLRRVADDETVGTTTLALVHWSASGRVLGAVMGDSTILRIRPGEEVLRVRPLRKFDYYFTESQKLAEADQIFGDLPWWMQVSLTSQLPWASQGIVPTLTDLTAAAGDVLIVCSDGISDWLQLDEFAALATRYAPPELPKELLRHARGAGSTDDATVVVAKWPERDGPGGDSDLLGRVDSNH